jgi:arylsulfatase A-like enzyme
VLRHYRKIYDLEGLAKKNWQTIVIAYLSMCSMVDQLVGRLRNELKEQGIENQTIFIFTSDNGDFTGEHGCAEKWDTCFYECLVHMPLQMQLPGLLPEGKRFSQLVELIDIAPTILDLCELPIPRWMMGRSLVPLMRGETNTHREAVFSEGGLEAEALARAPHYDSPEAERMKPDYYWKQKVLIEDRSSLARAKMVRTERFKYIYRVTGEEELYDLERDPNEFRNIASDPDSRGVIDEMRKRLLRWLVDTETDRPYVEKLFA